MSNYLETAPYVLVNLHRRMRIKREHATLGRLLTNARMSQPWREIGKQISTDDDFLEFWKEIDYQLQKSRRAKQAETPSQNRDKFLRIARLSGRLAESVRDGPLDLLAYEYFPPDVMKILGAPSTWPKLDSRKRLYLAKRLLREWPALAELLVELKKRATHLAKNALNDRPIAQRATRDLESNFFIRSIAKYFRQKLGGVSYATVAAIAAVAFEKEIDEDLVRQALSHEGSRSRKPARNGRHMRVR